MERILSFTCRNARKFLQLPFQNSPLLQNMNLTNVSGKMYSARNPTSTTIKLKTLHKQLGFLKSRALDERKDIDAKIAKLQKRIERIRKQLKKVAGDFKKQKKPRRKAKKEEDEQQAAKNEYSDKILEAGKAKENVHFLKLQRQQLEELRKKVNREKELLKQRLDELDKKIEKATKKNNERQIEEAE